MQDDDEERDLLAEVDATRARAEEEGPDAHVRALWALGAYYAERERTREAALTLRAAREAARAEVRESRSAPRAQAGLLLEIDLDLGAVELALGERRLAERVLREAERMRARLGAEGRYFDEPIAALRARMDETPEADPGSPDAPERFHHPRFGVGVLVAREGDRLRLRFEDGERVLLADRVTRCDSDDA